MEKVDLTILGATPGEIALAPGSFCRPRAVLKSAGNPFSTHIYRDLRLLIGTTGLGKVNAAAVAAAALSSFRDKRGLEHRLRGGLQRLGT